MELLCFGAEQERGVYSAEEAAGVEAVAVGVEDVAGGDCCDAVEGAGDGGAVGVGDVDEWGVDGGSVFVLSPGDEVADVEGGDVGGSRRRERGVEQEGQVAGGGGDVGGGDDVRALGRREGGQFAAFRRGPAADRRAGCGGDVLDPLSGERLAGAGVDEHAGSVDLLLGGGAAFAGGAHAPADRVA